MGRSVPTYRMKLEELIAELAPYRRALREEDRAAFDALMNRARRYASAAGYQASADPMETAVLSMLLGLEKEMEALKGRAVDRPALGGEPGTIEENTGTDDRDGATLK
jgi:hypothetical protein